MAQSVQVEEEAEALNLELAPARLGDLVGRALHDARLVGVGVVELEAHLGPLSVQEGRGEGQERRGEGDLSDPSAGLLVVVGPEEERPAVRVPVVQLPLQVAGRISVHNRLHDLHRPLLPFSAGRLAGGET